MGLYRFIWTFSVIVNNILNRTTSVDIRRYFYFHNIIIIQFRQQSWLCFALHFVIAKSIAYLSYILQYPIVKEEMTYGISDKTEP